MIRDEAICSLAQVYGRPEAEAPRRLADLRVGATITRSPLDDGSYSALPGARDAGQP